MISRRGLVKLLVPLVSVGVGAYVAYSLSSRGLARRGAEATETVWTTVSKNTSSVDERTTVETRTLETRNAQTTRRAETTAVWTTSPEAVAAGFCDYEEGFLRSYSDSAKPQMGLWGCRIRTVSFADPYLPYVSKRLVEAEVNSIIDAIEPHFLSIHIEQTAYLENMSEVVEKIDLAIDTARGRGVGIMLNDEGSWTSVWRRKRPTWSEKMMEEWRERTKIWSERYKPEYFTVINEPGAYVKRIGDMPTSPEFWRRLTVELCAIAKAHGAKKVGVSVPDGGLTRSPHGDYILYASTRPEVDFVSYDPFTYEGLLDIIEFTKQHGQEIGKEVVFNQIGVSLEGPNACLNQINVGNIHSEFPKLWVKACTAVAQIAKATTIEFFHPTLLFTYNFRQLEGKPEETVIQAIKTGRTEFAKAMKEINA